MTDTKVFLSAVGVRSRACYCLLFVSLSLVLSACAGPGGSDRAVGEKATYTRDLSDEEQARARAMIGSRFAQGLSEYRLNSGDIIEMLFLFEAGVEVEEYKIHAGDVLGLEFFYHPELSREVLVRPDGRITLPQQGEVIAAGLTPMELTATLVERYQAVFRDPQITVSVIELTSRSKELESTLEGFSLDGGRSRKFQVAPDGRIYPPFVAPVAAAGRTVEEVHVDLNAAYQKRFSNLEVSLQLTELTGNRVFVFGEVKAPGAYNLQGPQSVLQAVAMAGGWLPTAAQHNVRVVYWDENQQARVRSVDVENVAQHGLVSQELLLTANSTVYVPPSAITEANRFVDQYIRQLFLFNGTSLSVTYEQNFPGN